MQERIFAPLGLKDSGYDSPLRSSRSGRGATRAWAPSIGNAPRSTCSIPTAAGSLYSTVEYLLTWERALYGVKVLAGGCTSRRCSRPLGLRLRVEQSPSSPNTFGHKSIAHSGGINGFSSMLIRIPGENVTAIVLSNNSTVNAGRSRATCWPSTTGSRIRFRWCDRRQGGSGDLRRLCRRLPAGAELHDQDDARRHQPVCAGHRPGQIRGLPRIGNGVLRQRSPRSRSCSSRAPMAR